MEELFDSIHALTESLNGIPNAPTQEEEEAKEVKPVEVRQCYNCEYEDPEGEDTLEVCDDECAWKGELFCNSCLPKEYRVCVSRTEYGSAYVWAMGSDDGEVESDFDNWDNVDWNDCDNESIDSVEAV